MFPQPPFTPFEALNKECLSPQLDSNGPSTQENAPTTIDHVPGFPSVRLRQQDINHFLTEELATPVLDELHDHLWLVARRSGQNIDALHVQRLRGRRVLLSEDPNLHLVWGRNRIYIKPIPICLLNHHFWAQYLCQRYTDSGPLASTFDPSVAAGFLRSYASLIQHQSDFLIAQELHLIPTEVDWEDWTRFAGQFRSLGEGQVAKRYHYGQIRLSRLDWAMRILRPHQALTIWFYDIPYRSITNYLSSSTIPLLFIFASVSVVLSAMQVILTVSPETGFLKQLQFSGLPQMELVFWVFSIGILLASAAIWLLLLGVPIGILSWQLTWGYRNREVTQKP